MTPSSTRRFAGWLVCALTLGCGGNCVVPSADGNYARMDFTRAASLYDAPFPSDDLLDDSGHVRIDQFPNPGDIALVEQAKALLARDARGFATTGGIFLPLVQPLTNWHARDPQPAGEVRDGLDVLLLNLDRASPDFGRSPPLEVDYLDDGGPFGAPHLVTLRPVQGFPLRPATRYAAVLRRSFFGNPPGVRAPQLRQLQLGTQPDGMSASAFERYREAIRTLGDLGLPETDLAGLAVFTTDDPTAAMTAARHDALARTLPEATTFEAVETFDDYCVFRATLSVPVYQSGTPPYSSTGGDWLLDANGTPILQRTEEANLFVTIPRQPMPDAGWPTAVFIPTGGGGDRPLVDRGRHPAPGEEPVPPGSGPALEFARSGYAGASLDGPHGGRRNVTKGDEQFLMFNILNPAALRDNVRQAALEQALLAHVLEHLTLDVSSCAGASPTARFDTQHLALMGHSMGATIAPLTLAEEPLYGATILSGAGGSYIENVLHKRKPLEVKPLAEIMLGYEANTLRRHDPVLTLVQWAAEPADTQVYARRILAEPRPSEHPRHVLMLQGIVDHYILPRIANTLSLSLGLDLAGVLRDEHHPDMPPDQIPLAQWLPWAGRTTRSLPVQGNLSLSGDAVTAVVTQHLQDGFEDGHEVAFQTAPAKAQYRCFLRTWRAGVPRVDEACGE